MYIEQLLYLNDLLETGSMTATSEKFFITHQGISKAIHNLENELGVPLIAREGRAIALTEDGKNVIALSQPIIQQYRQIKQTYPGNQPANVISGDLQILCNSRVLDAYLGEIITRFLRKYPKIHITIQTHTFGEILNQFEGMTPNENTLGFFCLLQEDNNERFQEYMQSKQYHFHVYSTEEMFACLPKNKSADLADLFERLDKAASSHLPIFCYKYDYQQFFKLPSFSALRYEVNSIDVLKKFMSGGLGATIITNHEFEARFAGSRKYVLMQNNPPLLFDFGYLTYETELSPVAKLFLEFFLKDYSKINA